MSAGEKRLLDGKSFGSGRYESWMAGAGTWGSVCDHAIGYEHAGCVMCEYAGFTNATRLEYVPDTHLTTRPNSYPIAVRGMSCECGETWAQCASASSSCQHDKDVYLWCM